MLTGSNSSMPSMLYLLCTTHIAPAIKIWDKEMWTGASMIGVVSPIANTHTLSQLRHILQHARPAVKCCHLSPTHAMQGAGRQNEAFQTQRFVSCAADYPAVSRDAAGKAARLRRDAHRVTLAGEQASSQEQLRVRGGSTWMLSSDVFVSSSHNRHVSLLHREIDHIFAHDEYLPSSPCQPHSITAGSTTDVHAAERVPVGTK